MIIPTPEKWMAGEEVDAEKLNERSSAMLEFLLEPPMAMAKAAATQTINNGTWTVINLDTTIKDNDGIVDLANNRFTIVTPGWYEVMLAVGFGVNGTNDTVGRRIAAVRLNGSTANGGARGRRDTIPDRTSQNRSCRTGASLHAMFLNKDDYIELIAYQDSGSPRPTYSDSTSVPGYLAIRWVSN